MEAKVKEIQEQKDGSEKLRKEVSDLKDTVKEMTKEAASQATAAHQLGESAKDAKTKAEAAYTKVCIRAVDHRKSSAVLRAPLHRRHLHVQGCGGSGA